MATNRPNPFSKFRERLPHRLTAPSWARRILFRRLIAAALAVAAAVLAVTSWNTPREPAMSVLVTTKDLPAGAVLGDKDVTLRLMPVGYVPTGALTNQETVRNRILSGAARAGEPLTDLRLVGPESLTINAGDPKAAAVSIKLADSRVADLLHPGNRVDVIGADTSRHIDPVLATDAVVLAVRQADGPQGIAAGEKDRLVIVALPRDKAAQVAAAALSEPVAVTLR